MPNYANRGKWLETAVISSGQIYERRGLGYITKLATPTRQIGRDKMIRVKGSFDFMGHFRGLPLAFDAKATKAKSFPDSNVKQHQLDFLRAFASSGEGVGFLLVCFERADLAKTYAVTPDWYENQRDNDGRSSVEAVRFAMAALDPAQGVVVVTHGFEGVPVDFGTAAKMLFVKAKTKGITDALQKNRMGKKPPGGFPAG